MCKRENSGFVDGTHKNDIDYTFLLKLLAEPLERSVFKEGSSLLVKVLRGADNVSLKIFIGLLCKKFAVYDHKGDGYINVDSAFEVIKEECGTAERSTIETFRVWKGS